MNDFDGVDPDVLRRLLIEARQELDEMRCEVVRLRSIEEARQRHPSTTRDWCPPNGMRRPDLRLIGNRP